MTKKQNSTKRSMSFFRVYMMLLNSRYTKMSYIMLLAKRGVQKSSQPSRQREWGGGIYILSKSYVSTLSRGCLIFWFFFTSLNSYITKTKV